MNVLLLINPTSRGGRGVRLLGRIQAALDKHGIAYTTHILSHIQEAFDMAAKAVGFDVIAAVGGDGTVNAVGGGVLANPDKKLKFAVLYTGTSPDFCTCHNIPTEPEKAVALLAAGHTSPIPVLLANGKPFFCSCNPGMGAEVASGANRLRPYFGDKAGTFLALIFALLRNRRWAYRINGRELPQCNHLLITRMPCIASGLKLAVPELKEDQYLLWYLQKVTRWGWLKLLKKLYRGENCGTFEIVNGTLRIEGDAPFEFDGDPQGELPLEISLSARKLDLICGKGAKHE